MNKILIGNIVSFVGAIFMVIIGLIKKKDKILFAQCIQFGIMGIGNLILGGLTGFVANMVSILRNVVSIKLPYKLPMKLIFIIIQLGMTFLFNEGGWICWLPAIAACIFTWCLDTKSEVLIKWMIVLAQLMWAIYDISIRNFAGLFFDLLTVLTNLIGVRMVKKQNLENHIGQNRKDIIDSDFTPSK